MRTYSYTSSTSANTTQTYRGGYSHTTLRQNESNLLSNARSLRSNYGKKTAKGRQKDGKRTITIRQRVEIESISTEHIADRSPIRTDYSLRRNRFLRFTATLLLLLTLGVGEMWANYVYFYPVASGSDDWYADAAAFTVSFSSPDYDFCSYEEVNGGGTGVWRFNIGERTGTAYFKRRHKDACNGNWNQVSGTVDASHNVMKATGFSNSEMQSSYVINYIHGTNHVYFDNSNSNFTDNIYLVIGHDYAPNGSDSKYSSVYLMESVSGTNLYHVEITATWQDANYYAIVASTSEQSTLEGDHSWGTSSLSTKGSSGYTAAFKTVYNMEGGSFLITTDAAGNNQAMNINYYENHNSLPKFDASQAAKKRDTGTDYSDVVGSWPATLNLQGTYMSGSSEAARSTITSTASTDEAVNRTYGAIQSGAITQSYTSLDANYYFEGWGTGSTPSNAASTNEYHISATTTTYAFFSKLYTLTYDRKGDYSTSTVSVYSVDNYSGATTSGSAIPTGHMITLVATPATGYEVEGWYSDASCETAYTNGSGGVTIENGNNTFKLASLNTNSAVYPKFRPKTYTINLANMEATEAGAASVDVTYNASTNMTSAISKPSKTNYTFDGYWVRNESTHALETQLIDANGNWIKDVTGYTGHSGENPTWVHDYAISLYAKWTETPRTINLQVSPSGAGTLSPAGPVTAYIVTPSATITATPNAGWKFLRWDYGENVGPYAETGSDNTVQVTASVNGTLTAVFEPRYCLVGSLQDNSGNGGLPGWSDYTVDFTVNSSSPVDLTRTCTLQADKTYKVQVHDKATGSNLGRDGGESVCVLAEDASLLMENANNDVYLYTGGAGEYIFKITAIDGSGHPTLTVLRPHQVNFGQKYQDIDGTLHEGITGGSVAVAKTAGGALSPGDWVTYNTSVTHTATAASPGYTFTGWWGSDAFAGNSYSTTNPMTFAVTATDNAYAKFTEKATTVTLANDGRGHVEIGGVTAPTTTVGVTTTRELTAVPNEGYMFSSWTETAKTDYSTTSTSTNPTTLTGLGTGATSGQTLTANFTHRWALKAESDGWGSTEFTIANISVIDGKTIGYVDIALAANTDYQFKMVDKLTDASYKNGSDHVYHMTYGNSTNWSFATDKTYNCGITTAGKGTYRFLWNVTDKTMTVTYQPSYQVNYGASVGGSVTSVVDGDGNSVPNGGYVCSGGRITFTAAANTYYTFVGWCNNDTYGDTFNTELSWTNSNVTETQNSFAKFKSTNFVIYRTGDKADDSRAALDDVESYAGGTISEVIEYRMKVHTLDHWYTLCLPFTVNAVKVWDPDDSDGPAYFDIVPYYRTGEGLHSGHYFIRTPLPDTTGLAIANFDDWNDPNTAAYMPIKRVPYIIQWHDSYFLGKYISFFGVTGQEIPTRFRDGVAPNDNNLVNVYGNNTMHTGSVPGAYMLEPDYGSDGAWLRLDDASESRTIPPFECFIRASEPVTRNYVAIRRGMSLNDLSTGEAVIADNQIAPLIRVYTLSGILLTQYTDCSMSQVAYMLSIDRPAGIYILCSDKEAVKVIVGGK